MRLDEGLREYWKVYIRENGHLKRDSRLHVVIYSGR